MVKHRTALVAICLLCWVGAARTVAQKSSGIGWKADTSKAAIPNRSAAGMIHGQRFTVEQAEMQNGILKLRQGKEFFADREFMIFLFLNKGEKPDGKTFVLRPKRPFGAMVPHVYKGWKPPKETLPRTQSFMDKYTMRLQFGPSRNGRLLGQIYLCLPDKEKSFVAGTFTAAIK